jgi:hypothetical protein
MPFRKTAARTRPLGQVIGPDLGSQRFVQEDLVCHELAVLLRVNRPGLVGQKHPGGDDEGEHAEISSVGGGRMVGQWLVAGTPRPG